MGELLVEELQSNKQIKNVGSVLYNLGLGIFDAAKGTVEGIWGMRANPIN